MKVLVVGAGPTGAIVSKLVSQSMPAISVTVLDKARGVGGRMSTSRAKFDSTIKADLGAQYFTKFGSMPSSTWEKLESQGVLTKFKGNIEGQKEEQKQLNNYVAPAGANSVVKSFLGEHKVLAAAAEHSFEGTDPRRGCWE